MEDTQKDYPQWPDLNKEHSFGPVSGSNSAIALPSTSFEISDVSERELRVAALGGIQLGLRHSAHQEGCQEFPRIPQGWRQG